jgi:hypothetical protein
MSYNPKYKNENKLKIECPLKYSTPENGVECVQENCAWFMILQRACAVNVLARQKPKQTP